jgi:hypothetical protein
MPKAAVPPQAAEDRKADALTRTQQLGLLRNRAVAGSSLVYETAGVPGESPYP